MSAILIFQSKTALPDTTTKRTLWRARFQVFSSIGFVGNHKVMDCFDLSLPTDLLERASVRGNERAWPIADIPALIEAVRRAGLINIGGQLQFRFPSAGTCECYWIEVNTYQSDQPELPWNERVDRSAETARSQFEELPLQYDFVKEGRSAFGTYFDDVEANGGSIEDAMCFVWYVKAETR